MERNKKSPDADGYFFHALVWAFIISLFFIFVGLFLPDKLIALLGGDAQIVATGKNYTRIFMCFAPFFMWNYIVMLLCEMMEILPLRCPQLYSVVCSTSCLTIS